MSEWRFINNGKYFFKLRKPRNSGVVLKYANSNDHANLSESRETSNKNLVRGFENRGISEVTRRKIAKAVNVLGFGAISSQKIDEDGSQSTHLLSFITLTLPATQVHEDSEITKKILGSFLDLCRKKGFMANYVWRAEKQQNGNIHYHLVTDSFVKKSTLYRYWLLACESLGYVSAYCEKFKNLDYQQYARLPFNANVSESTIKGRFWRGNRNGWRRPPSLNLKNISGQKSLSAYISKYISKDKEGADLLIKGRVWGCSQSVSRGVEFFCKNEIFNQFCYDMATYVLKKKEIICDFFSFSTAPIFSVVAWFHKSVEPFFEEFRQIIVPCSYYRGGQSSFVFN